MNATVLLPYDWAKPPQTPPEHSDRLLWHLAYRLHTEHQPGLDGRCRTLTCRGDRWPCEAFKLAQAGFLAATWHLRKPLDPRHP
jgi:hypothetical protein